MAMLTRTLSNLVGGNVDWFVNDLFWPFLAFALIIFFWFELSSPEDMKDSTFWGWVGVFFGVIGAFVLQNLFVFGLGAILFVAHIRHIGKAVWMHITLWLFLYAVLDIMTVTRWTFFTHYYGLEFFLFAQVGLMALINNTRLEKYFVTINLIIFFIGSWLVSPGA